MKYTAPKRNFEVPEVAQYKQDVAGAWSCPGQVLAVCRAALGGAGAPWSLPVPSCHGAHFATGCNRLHLADLQAPVCCLTSGLHA